MPSRKAPLPALEDVIYQKLLSIFSLFVLPESSFVLISTYCVMCPKGTQTESNRDITTEQGCINFLLPYVYYTCHLLCFYYTCLLAYYTSNFIGSPFFLGRFFSQIQTVCQLRLRVSTVDLKLAEVPDQNI